MVVLQSLGDTQAVDVMTLVWVKLIVVLVTKCDDAEDRGCANVFAVIDTDVMLVSNLFVTSSHDQPATTSYTPNSIASQNHNAFILRRDGNADPAFGSLVLGGYDESRFTPNNVTFAFAADFSRDLTVNLRGISYDTLGSSPLLTASIPVFINSLVTHLWLPSEVCQRFEEAFNLTWSDSEQLYLLDNEAHERLSSLNPTFTLTLGHEGADGDSVEIALPYGAFDLSGTPPFTDPPSRYFPLKRAERAEQYTLGRVFLQGAYVVTDYERQNFSVSQALFPDASKKSSTTLVGIAPPGYREPSGGLSVGVIAGIVVGSVLGVLFVAVGLFYWQRWRKRNVSETDDARKTRADEKMASEDSPRNVVGPELDAQGSQRHELGDAGLEGNELDGVSTNVIELDQQNERKTELAGNGDSCERHELP
jgi:hypothetical protein